MNSRRETAAAHRPGRDAQRILPTAPPSQREAEIMIAVSPAQIEQIRKSPELAPWAHCYIVMIVQL